MAVTVISLLKSWLTAQAPESSLDWLEGRLEAVRGGDLQQLFLTFGLVPRKTGKADLALSRTELLKAEDARPGWNPSTWSVDHVARTLLLLSFPSDDTAHFVDTLDKLFAAGEVGELVALYQALPLLPHQPAHIARTTEGIRTNIKPVFTAIAHRNPYPAERLDEAAWNQLILKCLFIGAPLAPVIGLDERVNAPLMRMLCDYAHERWAAGRNVSPELWRCVGPIADEAALRDLKRAVHQGLERERWGAGLALEATDSPTAKSILASAPDVAAAVKCGQVTWERLATLP